MANCIRFTLLNVTFDMKRFYNFGQVAKQIDCKQIIQQITSWVCILLLNFALLLVRY